MPFLQNPHTLVLPPILLDEPLNEFLLPSSFQFDTWMGLVLICPLPSSILRDSGENSPWRALKEQCLRSDIVDITKRKNK